MGPTLIAYLRGAGALWLAAAAAAMGAAAAAAVGGGAVATVAALSVPGLDPPARGGEEWCTRGLKLCPSCVLTMPGPEKGRRWREREEEEVFFAKEEKGFEMKMKGGVGGGGGGGGGGGVGLNRGVRVCERFSPFNVHKWVLKLGLKKILKK